MPLVQVEPRSKENSQLNPALSTAHKPFCVTPSLTLRPVSLNDKNGLSRMTAPNIERGFDVGPEGGDAWKDELAQAVKKVTAAIPIKGREKK